VAAGRGPERPGERVLADLRRRIESGEWASGDQLPPITELASDYGVAQRTVSRAMAALESEGLIRRVPSWGTFRT
jgi:DNA-binding GntR family transcriptional regulator